MTKFWQTEARNEQKIKKLKNEYLIASKCPMFYVPTLKEEMVKNKNIHHYYKRNDKRWLDLQNIVLKAASVVVEIANLCLKADQESRKSELRTERKLHESLAIFFGHINF